MTIRRDINNPDVRLVSFQVPEGEATNFVGRYYPSEARDAGIGSALEALSRLVFRDSTVGTGDEFSLSLKIVEDK